LELDPTLGEAAILAAECAQAGNEFQRAADYLGRAQSANPRIRLRAAMLAANLYHHRLHHLSDAERAYRAALDLAPDTIDANAGLARLLGLCGRAREAVPYVLRLVRLGEPSDLLVLVARDDGVVHEPGTLELARSAAPDDPNPLVG